MKKTLSLLSALALCLALAACSSNPPPPGSSGPSQPAASAPAASQPAAADSDLEYVKNKGTLLVGITNFDPMDYQDSNGEWIGFDADMAKAFAESLGVTAEFVEITWDYKVMELNAKNIDCVWNGMTLNDEVKAAMDTSVPYCLNAQVLVVPADKAAEFENLTSLEGLNVAVESGSAGEDAAEALGAAVIPVAKQADTLMEVAAGTSDAAVIDLLMAGGLIWGGTRHAHPTHTPDLEDI